MTIISQGQQNGPNTYAWGLTATPQAFSGTSVTQANAFEVPASINIFSTVAPGAACKLPVTGNVKQIRIINRGANVLIVLPGPSWQIETQPVNSGVSIGVGGNATFISGDPNTTQAIWYAV